MKSKTYTKKSKILKAIFLIEMGICFIIVPDSFLNQINININAEIHTGEKAWHVERDAPL